MSETPRRLPRAASNPQRSTRQLSIAFASLATLTLGLIVLGALVRAHGAGLACPDWPLCFGRFLPEMNLKVGFEWTHRVVAGGVALLFATLGVKTWTRTDHGASIRVLLIVAAGLLAVQILLGALTVWLKLASWTVTAHLITGNGFSFTLVLIALALREQSGNRVHPHIASARARAWVVASALLLFTQLVLGGLVSSQYAGMACPEWPTCNGGVFFPTWAGSVGLHLLHRMNGYALIGCLAVTAWVCRSEPALRAPAAVALSIGIAQLGVGVANVLTGIRVEVTGLHSALAALLVVASAFCVRELGRTTDAAPAVPATSAAPPSR